MDLVFFPNLGGLGKSTAFGQHLRRYDSLKQLYAEEQHQRIVEESDKWNEAGNELNGAKQVSDRAGCKEPCVPAYSRVSEREIVNMRFSVEASRLSLQDPQRQCFHVVTQSGSAECVSSPGDRRR